MSGVGIGTLGDQESPWISWSEHAWVTKSEGHWTMARELIKFRGIRGRSHIFHWKIKMSIPTPRATLDKHFSPSPYFCPKYFLYVPLHFNLLGLQYPASGWLASFCFYPVLMVFDMPWHQVISPTLPAGHIPWAVPISSGYMASGLKQGILGTCTLISKAYHTRNGQHTSISRYPSRWRLRECLLEIIYKDLTLLFPKVYEYY